ncbi:MAG: hydrolase [Taibaiella sp.]|nr:hydrolase [Taibaiella sp.]
MVNKSKNRFDKFACACCGFFTISEIHDICDVCYWEEDIYQEEHIFDNGGSNKVCLADAKQNMINFGACEIEFINFVRVPTTDEQVTD